jgi:hypothetical protein
MVRGHCGFPNTHTPPQGGQNGKQSFTSTALVEGTYEAHTRVLTLWFTSAPHRATTTQVSRSTSGRGHVRHIRQVGTTTSTFATRTDFTAQYCGVDSCDFPQEVGGPACVRRTRRVGPVGGQAVVGGLGFVKAKKKGLGLVVLTLCSDSTIFGRRGGIRTRDPLHPMQVRYQAALHAEP